jgi:hypothetical protein
MFTLASFLIMLIIVAVGIAIGVQIGAKITADAYHREMMAMFDRHGIR